MLKNIIKHCFDSFNIFTHIEQLRIILLALILRSNHHKFSSNIISPTAINFVIPSI